MSHEWVLWAMVAASALHVAEERALGWQGWATGVLGPRFGARPTWDDFWATNAALIVIGIATASVAWRAPAFALAFPALALINAVFFHVLPSIQARRPNPGCFTAVLLYVPVGLWCYDAAGKDDVLSAGALVGSVALGALLMAFALVNLMLKARFAYADARG
ncbi:MAG TPA: HXXEE domain-containing protein [Capillimicrobium sp.]|nr:HXXEE domain-containing protein [Capillimicrobium sp.]